MDAQQFLTNWNVQFPKCPLTVEDLKKPTSVMWVLFQLFEKLGIDRKAVLDLPFEENENSAYYSDLLPVINMIRVTNHLVAVRSYCSNNINILTFLQPTATSSNWILMVLFNLMLFNEERLRDVAPHEQALFAKTEQVKTLEERKNKCLEMLNKQAEEKGKRAERLEKIDMEIRQLEEELKQEKEAHVIERQELEDILKENKQINMLLEQKKSHRDALIAEVAKKRALRVYDADDIKAQAEQAAQNVREAEEKLNSLKATLMQKETSLKNLQNIKPTLDTANNLLHDIMKLSDSLKECSSGDLDGDSQEGELAVLGTELGELQALQAELRAARQELARRRNDAQPRRQHDRALTHSALREAEDKDKKLRERSKKALQRTEEIKQNTVKYDSEKSQLMDEMAAIDNEFATELKDIEEMLLKLAYDAKSKIEDTLQKRNT